MEMGKEIRRLRQDRGLTQEALAAALNVSAQTVSKWECGNTIPDVQLLPQIAVYFGVSIDQLFAMSPEQQMERMENRIYGRGLFDEAEQRQLEAQLRAFGEDPKLKGRAELLLTKLYNNQAEQYKLLAVEHGKTAVEETKGDHDALSELCNAWNSFVPDWSVRNHHALIEWLSDYCGRNPENRAALMWLLDNLIDDRRLTEAKVWLEKLTAIDNTFRTPMYRYQIALAEGKGEADERLAELEALEDDWCLSLVLGDIYTQRQEYDRAVALYKKGLALQKSPKFTDGPMCIAHIREIQGDKAGAIEAYREVLRLMREEWGIVSGEMRESIERIIRRLQA